MFPIYRKLKNFYRDQTNRTEPRISVRFRSIGKQRYRYIQIHKEYCYNCVMYNQVLRLNIYCNHKNMDFRPKHEFNIIHLSCSKLLCNRFHNDNVCQQLSNKYPLFAIYPQDLSYIQYNQYQISNDLRYFSTILQSFQVRYMDYSNLYHRFLKLLLHRFH